MRPGRGRGESPLAEPVAPAQPPAILTHVWKTKVAPALARGRGPPWPWKPRQLLAVARSRRSLQGTGASRAQGAGEPGCILRAELTAATAASSAPGWEARASTLPPAVTEQPAGCGTVGTAWPLSNTTAASET